LSGDNPSAKQQLAEIFPRHSQLRFQQTPQQKLDFVESMQSKGQKVLMVGDGINDAGALKQSDVGISIVEDTFSFSPASDAILQGEKIGELYKFLKASKLIKYFIIAMFIYSLLYNVIGLSYAVSGNLKPVIAAILMPASSISVILLAYLGTSFIYQKLFRNK
jgi:Cu+-exporting ATPase